MSGSTPIEWTDATWNPVRGCAKVSEGCRNCYAMRQAHRTSGPGGAYEGLTDIINGRPQWTGAIRLVEAAVQDPLHWRKPRRIFVNSMSDLFHEVVPDWFLDEVFAVMACAHWHTFQILTKRPERALNYLRGHAAGGRHIWQAGQRLAMPRGMHKPDTGWPLPNVWLGVSVEDHDTFDERAALLCQTPAALRFISAEPLLGPIGLLIPAGRASIDWVIAGGESGPGARPMHPYWVRSLREQCLDAGVPFFFKQWGDWAPVDHVPQDAKPARDRLFLHRSGETATDPAAWAYGACTMLRVGKKAAGRLLDGTRWNEFPH